MALASFDTSTRRVLADEGGYSNDPDDPGGPTNKGITIATYRRYVNPNGTIEDLKRLTVAQAEVVYKARYWDAVRGDNLPAGVDYSLYDYAVNSGVGRAGKVIRRLVGLGDGAAWADTLAAIKARDPLALVDAIHDERLRFLKSLRTWRKYGGGWQARVNRVRLTSRHLRDPQNSVPAAMPTKATPKKGRIDNINKGGTTIGAGTGTVASVAVAVHSLDLHGIAIAALCVGGAAVLGLILYLSDKHAETLSDVATPGVPIVPPLPAHS